MFGWLLKESNDPVTETAKDTGCLIFGVDRQMLIGALGADNDHDKFIKEVNNRRKITDLETKRILANRAATKAERPNSIKKAYIQCTGQSKSYKKQQADKFVRGRDEGYGIG